jgi:ribonuclease-3
LTIPPDSSLAFDEHIILYLIVTLTVLQNKLGYTFNDIHLLTRALTHRSAGTQHNERLEFLGDAILGFEVADHLYHRVSEADEGKLSRMRAHLVKGETLAAIARDLQLGTALNLGQGELLSGGSKRESTLSDAVEAIIAAVYLDGGMREARALVHRLLVRYLDNPAEALQLKDPKTRLQEMLQSRGLDLPIYAIQQTKGKQHNPVFVVSCQVNGLSLSAVGQDTSRRKAEQQAAAAVLRQLS